MQPSLEFIVYLKGATLGFTLPEAGSVKVGRGAGNEIRIDDSSVSRDHVMLHVDNGLTLEELGSSNGTQHFPCSGEGKETPDLQALQNSWYLKKGRRVRVAPGDMFRVGSVPCVIQVPEERGASAQARLRRLPGPSPHGVVVDPEMRRVYELAQRAAQSDIGVLILGETGVGKALLAETIHHSSRRASGEFMRLSCVARSEAQLESELFGYEAGAFPGATEARAGILELCSGGTVFLDEIGELPLKTQASLLRVLEERSVTRVGATRALPVDVRFVAATNRNLQLEIAQGHFRGDLFYRLSGIQLRIPALREGKVEIEPHLLRPANDGIGFSELERTAVTQAPGQVRGLASARVPTSDFARLARPKAELERQRVLDALEQCGGNQTRAAKLLGFSRRTLINRLDAFGVPRPRKRVAQKG